MSPIAELLAAFAIFLILLTVGLEIPLAIGVPSVIYLYLQGGMSAFRALGVVSWGSMDSFTLMAAPLFILMAEILQRSGLTTRIFSGLAKFVSRLPGGLLQTSMVGCAVFATMSGSSIVTAASVGGVALPELARRKYHRRISAGALAAGGTLGILFPPSVALIVYSTFTELSVAKLFMASLVPGLILTAVFMIYIAVWARLRPEHVPVERGVGSLGELGTALLETLPFLLLIGCILGSIYAGIATPTEAGAVGCVAVLVLAGLFGRLSTSMVLDALRATIVTSGNILFIVYTAFLFSYAISYAGVGNLVTKSFVDLHLSRPAFFLALFVLYTVLGCLVESLGMIVITVPLLHPILQAYGVDPIWFGIILVLFIELGQISPPIGINLFVIQSMFGGDLGDVVLGTVPFHLLMVAFVFVLMVFPEIALWLPSHMSAG